MTIPPITRVETPRLMLRVCQPADADAVFAGEADSIEELRPWFWWCHPTHTLERSRGWAESRIRAWEKGEELSFLIIDRSDDRIVGCIWLNEIDLVTARGSLGYWLRTGYAGRGLATEAGHAVARWAFAAGFERIDILTAVQNKRSQSLAERLGARLEALLPGRLKVGDEVQDARLYTLCSSPAASGSASR